MKDNPPLPLSPPTAKSAPHSSAAPLRTSKTTHKYGLRSARSPQETPDNPANDPIEEVPRPSSPAQDPPHRPTALVPAGAFDPFGSQRKISHHPTNLREIDPSRPINLVVSYDVGPNDLPSLQKASSEMYYIQRVVSHLSVPIASGLRADVSDDIRRAIRAICTAIGATIIFAGGLGGTMNTVEETVYQRFLAYRGATPATLDQTEPTTLDRWHQIHGIFSDHVQAVRALRDLIAITGGVIDQSGHRLMLGLITRIPDSWTYRVVRAACTQGTEEATIWIYCQMNQDAHIEAFQPIIPTAHLLHVNSWYDLTISPWLTAVPSSAPPAQSAGQTALPQSFLIIPHVQPGASIHSPPMGSTPANAPIATTARVPSMTLTRRRPRPDGPDIQEQQAFHVRSSLRTMANNNHEQAVTLLSSALEDIASVQTNTRTTVDWILNHVPLEQRDSNRYMAMRIDDYNEGYWAGMSDYLESEREEDRMINDMDILD
ncbi:hypothetical protein CAC42_3356 [Sphaceloma murrayae]|uniref:Uncharacterized protein n=1 Tax=Sphaceloma murrayae TaxID=2082308 RepID=A0A2K1R143_9PEZI|nr:hypothetical protein CAC42_3356 [Sphaceloma murrayae]